MKKKLYVFVGFLFLFLSGCKVQIPKEVEADILQDYADEEKKFDKIINEPEIKLKEDETPDQGDPINVKKNKKQITPLLIKFNPEHKYKIDISGLTLDEIHIPYETFQDKLKIGDLFEHGFSKAITNENMKKMDPVLQDLVTILGFYSENQVDLVYGLSTFVESLDEKKGKTRTYPTDYYYPHSYLHYGIESDFENVSMMSYVLYSVCVRPILAELDFSQMQYRMGINFNTNEYDENQIFQNNNSREENFQKTLVLAARCNIDAGKIFKSSNQLTFDPNKEKRLDVETKISKDGKTLNIALKPTDLQKLSVLYQEPIVLIDSQDKKLILRSIKDESPDAFIIKSNDGKLNATPMNK